MFKPMWKSCDSELRNTFRGYGWYPDWTLDPPYKYRLPFHKTWYLLDWFFRQIFHLGLDQAAETTAAFFTVPTQAICTCLPQGALFPVGQYCRRLTVTKSLQAGWELGGWRHCSMLWWLNHRGVQELAFQQCPGNGSSWETSSWLSIRAGRMHAGRLGLRSEEETVWETLPGSQL